MKNQKKKKEKRKERIIGIKEEYQLKGTENTTSKIVEENYPNLKKEMSMKRKKVYGTPNNQIYWTKKKSPYHTIIKPLPTE